jgi:serine/threonine protein kinase
MNSQVFKGTQYTPACDIYSLAVCMWEVFSRRVPYSCATCNQLPDMSTHGNNVTAWYTHELSRNPHMRPSPMPSPPEASFEIDDLIRRAWATNYADRPDAVELCDRLADIAHIINGGDVPMRSL